MTDTTGIKLIYSPILDFDGNLYAIEGRADIPKNSKLTLQEIISLIHNKNPYADDPRHLKLFINACDFGEYKPSKTKMYIPTICHTYVDRAHEHHIFGYLVFDATESDRNAELDWYVGKILDYFFFDWDVIYLIVDFNDDYNYRKHLTLHDNQYFCDNHIYPIWSNINLENVNKLDTDIYFARFDNDILKNATDDEMNTLLSRLNYMAIDDYFSNITTKEEFERIKRLGVTYFSGPYISKLYGCIEIYL